MILADQYHAHARIVIDAIAASERLARGHGHVDASRQQRTQHCHDLARAFWHTDGHGIARCHAMRHQRLGAAPGALHQLGVGPALLRRDHGRRKGCALRLIQNALVQQTRRNGALRCVDPRPYRTLGFRH